MTLATPTGSRELCRSTAVKEQRSNSNDHRRRAIMNLLLLLIMPIMVSPYFFASGFLLTSTPPQPAATATARIRNDDSLFHCRGRRDPQSSSSSSSPAPARRFSPAPLLHAATRNGSNNKRSSVIDDIIASSSAAACDVTIILDVENIRGKSGFAYTHDQFFDLVGEWMKSATTTSSQASSSSSRRPSLHGKVICVMDHGSEPTRFYLPQHGYCVVFAGPTCKADDVIVNDAIPFALTYHCGDDNDDEKSAVGGGSAEHTGTVTTAATAAESTATTVDATTSAQKNKLIYLVTADQQLIQRSRKMTRSKQYQNRASSRSIKGRIMDQPKFKVVSPVKLLEEMESMESMDQEPYNEQGENVIGISSEDEQPQQEQQQQRSQGVESALDAQIRLGGELLEAEALLRSKQRGVNNKRKKKLKHRVQQLRTRLAGQGDLLQRLTRILDTSTSISSHDELLTEFTSEQQDALLQRWRKIRAHSKRKEQTGDRIILAEALRRTLLDQFDNTADDDIRINGAVVPSSSTTTDQNDGDQKTMSIENKGSSSSPAFAFVQLKSSPVLPVFGQLMLSRQQSYAPDATANLPLPSSSATSSSPLRLVIVSDTHGYERQLGDKLPDGDILLHLGDFAVDNGNVKRGLDQFDAWLARQSHIPNKFVVRGNHDPRKHYFEASQATYITKPTCLRIHDYFFAFVPFATTRSRGGLRSMPKSCDVLVSHVPPKGILDRCYTAKHAGSNTLLRGAQRMKGGPPALLLCGHIHEGRGALSNIFCGNKETLVINAANANLGRATHIEHGPVVVDVTSKSTRDKRATLVDMDGQYKHLNAVQSKEFFSAPAQADDNKVEMMMAVDLGLRTGLALFSSNGELVRYGDFVFDSAQDLYVGAMDIMAEWEADATSAINEGHTSATANTAATITHVAIEGGDPPLRDAWRQAVNGRAVSLSVKPEQWRDDLLSRKEQIDGASAKAASRLIARQIVADYRTSTMPLHSGKFQTDAAEAIVMGLHVARRLGWIQREPSVRRYTNGNIILPSKEDVLVQN